MAAFSPAQCVDFLQFQEVLQKMRLLDDTIIYALNTQIPTESFHAQKDCQEACKDLFGKLETNYRGRENALKQCLDYSTNRVSDLKGRREKDSNNPDVLKELRKEQTKVRLLQTEQGVEEVIRNRTRKVFYERCRTYYLPADFLL